MSKSIKRLSLSVLLAVIGSPVRSAEFGNPADSVPTGPYPWNYSGTLERTPRPSVIAGNCPITAPQPRVLLAGDSWAQYMWDDDAHNEIFDKFGHADKLAVSRSLGSNPGPGYSGPEYAISGSEAREWVNTASYPWIANVVAELQSLPGIDTVLFSLGGNDILAGRSGGGWYKDMDLDQAGAEQALFAGILADSDSIAQTFLAVRPQLQVMVSSYEYPNFNVSALWCWIYACPKREDLSRNPSTALVTDQELNAMNLDVEGRRIAWTNANPRLDFDHGVGEMHYYYGDGVAAAGVLPRPGQLAPDYQPFPGGQPNRPSLRENFRAPNGIPADPIHLDAEGYLFKVAVQTETHFLPRFRGEQSLTLHSQGGSNDGWTDGVLLGTGAIAVGDDGTRLVHGLVSFDTSAIPADAEIASASLYLLQDARSGINPFTAGNLGAPRLDVASGGFGNPQVELGDAEAAATADNAGCFVGSANSQYYALRVDLSVAGLASIQRGGLTQLRLAFSSVDPGINRVEFKDGDAQLGAAAVRQTFDYVDEIAADGSVHTRLVMGAVLEHRGLAEVLGSAKPFLDIRFSAPIFADGFE